MSQSSAKSNNTKSRQPQEVEVGIGDYWHAFTKTKAFIPVLSIVIALLLFGIDLLVSWNGYELFFLLVGFELIAAAVARLIYMIYTMGKNKAASTVTYDDNNEVL